jgi:BirA family transcriptional regulator, biotin operon repressor / biotin---[acetyl-CoA-carboxylase] ligase
VTLAPGIDEAALRAALGEAGSSGNRDVAVYAEIDSTSDELRRRLAAGVAGPGSIAIAGSQTRGRGRLGRSWFSPGDGHLYVSLGVAVPGPPSELVPLVPLAAGVSAVDALAESGAAGILLKWPNDLLRGGRKVGGILCEALSLGPGPAIIVVGLGANTGNSRFDGELARTAGCLDGGPGGGPRPETVAAVWVKAVERWVERLARGEREALVSAWIARAEPFGRRARASGIEGTTAGLDDRGRLLIRTDGGEIAAIPGGVVEDAD